MSWVSMRHKQVTINKPHRCDGCCKVLTKGDRMISWAGITDGSWLSGYRCLICDEIMGLIDDDGDGFGPGFALDSCDPGETILGLLDRLKIEKAKRCKQISMSSFAH